MRALLITDLTVATTAETIARASAIAAQFGEQVAFGVRDHDAATRERVVVARALVAVGARVVVHDRCDVALAVGAAGVQLGERSLRVRDARALLGSRAFVGRSCHDEAGLREAAEDGADAATLSPVFASPGKGAPLGVERFAALRASVPALRVLALGGVDANNASRVRRAGADGVAVIRAWLACVDPVAVVGALVRDG